MLELIEQGQLVEQHGTQDDQLRPFQASDRNLATLLKHVFEQAVEWLDRLMTHQVKDTTNVHTRVRMGVRATT